MPGRVLFVCTGNICRSPLAEYAAKARFSNHGIIFESAGTHAAPGSPATNTMVSVGDELDLDLRTHRSRSIHDVDQPDLALCMERVHVSEVGAAFPELDSDAIRLLSPRSIPDPYGQTTETYRVCADEIAAAIGMLNF